MIQEGAHDVGGPQLHLGLRGGRHAGGAARLRRRRAGRAALHLRALERQRLSRPRQRRGDPAGDARRPPQPRHGGASAGSSRPTRRSRPRAIAATGPTTRRSPTSSSSTGADWFERLARIEPWDAVLALEPEPAPHPGGRRARRRRSTVAADFIDLKSPVHGRAQPPVRRARVRRGADRSGSTTRRSRRSAAPRSCTTSARPSCPTRSGTSPARSRAPSSTASSCTRCSPSRCCAARRRSARLNPVAAAHHEKADGSGYHKASADRRRRHGGPCVLAATDVYVGLTTDRADRPALRGRGRRRASCAGSSARACSTRRRPTRCSPPPATAPPDPPRGRRAQHPGGLTRREVEVLRLAARGLTTRADRRAALHLPQDGRPPHPARLHEDRRLHARRRRPLGDAERDRGLRSCAAAAIRRRARAGGASPSRAPGARAGARRGAGAP